MKKPASTLTLATLSLSEMRKRLYSLNQEMALVGAFSMIVETSRRFVSSSIVETLAYPLEGHGHTKLILMLINPTKGQDIRGP